MFDKPVTIATIGQLLRTFPQFHNRKITAETLSDGRIFTELLATMPDFTLAPEELSSETNDNWMNRLRNWKLLQDSLEKHLAQTDNGLQCQDIDFVYISRQNSVLDIEKFLEVVIGVLMIAQNKQDYIERIMTLQQSSQQKFAATIQQAMTSRICSLTQAKNHKIVQNMRILQSQNMQLQDDNEQLIKQNEQLREKVQSYERSLEQMQFSLGLKSKISVSQSLDDLTGQNQHRAAMIENLRQKLLQMTRQHEQQTTQLTIELNELRQKQKQMETIEDMVIFYREKYQETVQEMNKMSFWNKEKVRYEGFIEEKDFLIAKLQETVQNLTKKAMLIQQREIDTKIEMQKRQTRLKELERDMRNRLNNSIDSSQLANVTENRPLSLSKKASVYTISGGNEDWHSQNETNKELKRLSDNYEKKNKELQKQNTKLQRKADNCKLLEMEKKKLESILVEIIQKKNEEMEIVVAALHETQREYSNLFRTFVKK